MKRSDAAARKPVERPEPPELRPVAPPPAKPAVPFAFAVFDFRP